MGIYSNMLLEFRCPLCGHVNAISVDTLKDMYKEQREPCQQCNQMLEIIPANGVNDQINLIVSEA